MATKSYRFHGESNWAKIHKPDTKFGVFYMIDVFLDEPSIDLYKKSGIQGRIKDVDGRQYVTFRRPEEKVIKGETIHLGKPKVTDSVGRDIDDLVGNGSSVSVTVSVYDTKKGKGHQLDVVQVNELVKYGGANSVEDAHGDSVEDDTESRVEVSAKTPAKKPATPRGSLNDPLPF